MRRWGVLAVAVVLAGSAPAAVSDVRAHVVQPSLPRVTSGARPGPPVLYADAPAAPQLENRDPHFRAEPLLVMGEEAYVDGEYLYQDWIYDDNGADTGAIDPGGTDTAGDVEYPAVPARYGGNAADLVELRIVPRPTEVRYRFTLNTLLVPDSTIITLAFDTDIDLMGFGPITSSHGLDGLSGEEIITTWGTGAEHTALRFSHMDRVATYTTPLSVQTDLDANQITVTVPRSVSDPQGTWWASLAAGVYDSTTGGYLQTSRNPAMPTSAAYDLGLTFDEAPAGQRPHDAAQAAHLKSNDLPTHPIDFAALAARHRRTTVPTSGTMGRIFPSRVSFGEGKDYDATPELRGQLQPYSIYVPTTYEPRKPVGLVLDLHSLGEHHWQYNDSVGVQQLGEERGAIVITCECRGDDGWYQDEAEYDVFEMWNDVARHYELDPNRVAITGYSMGGYATYRLATLYPDLFGKALSIVGPPTGGIWAPPTSIGHDESLTNLWLENARNVPFLNAVAVEDELVPYTGTRAQNMGAPGIVGFDQLGYRFRFLSYPTAEHLTIGALDYDLPYQVEWLGDAHVDHDPTHVTFSYLPEADSVEYGLVHDHAYWVSGIVVADRDGELRKGTVDAFTHAHGRGDPPSESGQTAGHGPLPYVEEFRTWGQAPASPVANRLTLTLTNVGEVTIDGARAGLDGSRPIILEVTSDVTAVVRVAVGGVTRVANVTTGTSTITL